MLDVDCNKKNPWSSYYEHIYSQEMQTQQQQMNSIEGSAYHKCFIRILITQRNVSSLGLLIQSSGDLIEIWLDFI